MRVITGKYKGRRFDVPRSFAGHPTTDFAKESLFNIMRGLIKFDEVHALDLFAGTGAISIELLSRGCTQVISVEKDPHNFALLRRFSAALSDPAWTILRDDAMHYIAHSAQGFEVVFADPPYALPELPLLPKLVLESRLLTNDGIFVLEHGSRHDFSQSSHIFDHRRYGAVNFSFFRKTSTIAKT